MGFHIPSVLAHGAPPYYYVPIDFPNATSTQLRGISNNLDMVGIAKDASGLKQAGLWLVGQPAAVSIDANVLQSAFDNSPLTPKGKNEKITNVTAEGINDVRQVVGRFDTSLDNEFGYWLQLTDPYQPPSAKDFTVFSAARVLPLPGVGQKGNTETTDATGINNQGDICGLTYTTIQSSAMSSLGFLMNALDTTKADKKDADPFMEVYGVNGKKDLVGCFNFSNTQAFMLPSGASVPTPLPLQLGAYSRAQGINSFGTVVGRTTSGGPTNPQSQPGYAFIWESSTPLAPPTPFGYPSAKSTYANGINDMGYIVGEFREAADPGSASRGFLRCPLPLPYNGMPPFPWPSWLTFPP